MRRLGHIPPVFLALPMILLFFFLALDSMVGDSPTMDEQNHLARGLVFLRTGDARFSLEHPPLVNSLSAMPLLMLPEIRLPMDHPSWNAPQGWYAFAEQLLWLYNHDVERMVFLARLPIVFLTLGLGLVGYRFGLRLWGKHGALLVLIFLLFDPNLLANGRYTTTDVGGAAFLYLAAFLLWRLWAEPSWRWSYLVLAGLGVGLALGSKLSNLVFLPVFALLALLPLYAQPWSWRDCGRRLAQYAVALCLSLLILWAIYAFEWDFYTFRTDELAVLNQGAGPLPTFLAGVEQILRLTAGGRPSFLLGQFSTEGWWYYFPVAFLVKTPIMVILLFALAAFLLLKRRTSRGRAAYLILPPAGFLLISMQSGLNIGYRHLLPMLPFLYTLAAGVSILPGVSNKPNQFTEYLTRYALIGAVLSVLLVDLWIHPHYLSYFNVAAGGPANGAQVLIDSNIDWGQDLKRLETWMRENEVEKVKLAWFGTADPSYYGIDYDPLPGLPHHFELWWNIPFNTDDPEPGVYAISVSNLWELPLQEKSVFAWFREREPDDRVGYSMNIYIVSGDE